MKEHLSFCTTITTLVTLMISGSGCAQTYVPRRYYGTTYTTVPRVYTSQPVVTYSQPVVTYSQPYVTYRTPTYRTTYTTAAQPAALRTVGSVYDANARAAEISRQIERQTAEIEARVKRQTQEIEERVRRQTEEIERQIARQTAEVSRQVTQSTWRQPSTRVAYIPQDTYATSATSSYAQPTRTIYQTRYDTPSCSDAMENACEGEEDGGESYLDAIVAKTKEWGAIATNFLQAAPWWIWVGGVILLFVIVFLLSVRDAHSQPFQARDDNPWVIDPANN